MESRVARIIEYQMDKQRTPTEALEFLNDRIDDGSATHVVVIYRNDDFIGHVPASANRDYKKSNILWDVEHWKHHFLTEDD